MDDWNSVQLQAQDNVRMVLYQRPSLKVEIFKKCSGPEQRSVLWFGRGVFVARLEVPSTLQIEKLSQVLFKVHALVIKEYLLL